ncbi:MAG: VOC family protein [Chloroflexi bacterium]|nr:VOC family protein [Chloroflexota bacterium]
MSALNWFEIPVTDIERAAAFYNKVLDTQLHVQDLTEQMGSMIGMFPSRDGVTGALVQNAQYGYTPSSEGTMVYLIVDGDLSKALERVEPVGGKVVLPKTPLGADTGAGFCGWIIDTEGNRVGLFSNE